MRLVAKGKALGAWKSVKGMLSYEPLMNAIKLTTEDGKTQYILTLSEFERGKLLGCLLRDQEAVEAAFRNGWMISVIAGKGKK